MKIPAILAALLGVSVWAFGQEQNSSEKAPATKLEAFQSRTGIVLVRAYTTVATITGKGGTITVDAREFRDAADPKSRTTGISITVTDLGRVEREHTSYVDTDEVDSLLAGIDDILKVGKDVTALDFFEAMYRTKGDFKISVGNVSSGGRMALISSGSIGGTSSLLTLDDVSKLREAIVLAKSKLE